MSTPTDEKKDTGTNALYDVVLLNAGNRVSLVARAIRVCNKGSIRLYEAKQLTKDLPKVVLEGVDEKRAHEIAEWLIQYDTGVRIRKHVTGRVESVHP